jgi:hypothetical protein
MSISEEQLGDRLVDPDRLRATAKPDEMSGMERTSCPRGLPGFNREEAGGSESVQHGSS